MGAELKPATLFIVTHPFLAPISKEEALAAVPTRLSDVHYEIIPVDVSTGTLADLDQADFDDLCRRQESFFRSSVKPRLDQEKNREVLYVGKAPIPLALHLGALLEPFEKVSAGFLRHDTGTWYTAPQPDSATGITVAQPAGGTEAAGEVVILIETSLQIAESDVRGVIAKPLATYKISVDKIHRDSMNQDVTKKLVSEFNRILEHVHQNFPNRNGIHIFAATAMGVAFELGASLNPTIFHPIATYQYFKRETPPYRKAIVVGGVLNSPGGRLSDEQLKTTEGYQSIWKDALGDLQKTAEELRSVSGSDWLGRLFPGTALSGRLTSSLVQQKSLADSSISDFSISDKFDSGNSEFTFENRNKVWVIGSFLAYHFGIAAENDRAKHRQLVRLFLMHEAIHSERHRLKRENAEAVGRFPRVLEEIDYDADVWALCHELHRELKADANAKPRVVALDLILQIVKSFLAFDHATDWNEGVQARRVNRYLIWLWQLVLLEQAHKDISVDEVIAILLDKPVIDLAGPQISCRNERIFLNLNTEKLVEPEIAIYWDGKFTRLPGDVPKAIFEGLRTSNLQKMVDALTKLRLTI